jgi:hypothetical protein
MAGWPGERSRGNGRRSGGKSSITIISPIALARSPHSVSGSLRPVFRSCGHLGGHAIYLNAGEIAAHIPPANFPGQAIAVALYREYGIRSVEIGSLMFAHPDPDSGEMQYPKMELVRLAIPRRVYSASQLDYVAEAVINIAKKSTAIASSYYSQRDTVFAPFYSRATRVVALRVLIVREGILFYLGRST